MAEFLGLSIYIYIYKNFELLKKDGDDVGVN